MREFTIKEKYIVKGLFDRKNESNLAELRTTKLLRNHLDCFALRWELAPRKFIKIYMKQEDAKDIAKLNKQYFKICDFLYFIDELEANHYIKLQTISFAKDTFKLLRQALYDTSKYQYGLPKDIEHSGNLDCFYEIADNRKRLYAVEHIEQNAYTDCVDLLNKYYDKIIYPLPLLEDLVKHEYKSIEQRNFEKQIEENDLHHKEQMRYARNSFYVALLAVVVSAAIPLFIEKCAEPIETKKSQLKSLEQSIIQSKIILSDTVNVQLCQPTDTLKTLNTIK